MNALTRKLLFNIKEALLYLFRAIWMSWPVWFLISNHRGRGLFARQTPTLSTIQQRIVDSLKKEGIATTHIDELFPNHELLAELQTYATELRPFAEQKTNKKPFILEYWDAEPVLSLDNPFVRLSLDTTVLDIMNSYMQMWSKFYYYMLGQTAPVLPEVPAQASQRWHRDFEEIRMCKMFIYLSDVTEESGPFVYIRGSHLGGPWRSVFPQKPGKGCYPPDGGVEKKIPKSTQLICTGKAGTIVFADTTGLHRGGYGKAGGRIMFTAGYNSSAALGRRRYHMPADQTTLKKLPLVAQFAFRGMPPKKTDAHESVVHSPR